MRKVNCGGVRACFGRRGRTVEDHVLSLFTLRPRIHRFTVMEEQSRETYTQIYKRKTVRMVGSEA